MGCSCATCEETVENCSTYDDNCYCTDCDEGYDLVDGTCVAKETCSTDLTCTGESGNTWCCPEYTGLPLPLGEKFTCGTTENTCCYYGVCCDTDEVPFYNGTTEDISCCSKETTQMAWAPATTGSYKMCCEVGTTHTIVTGTSGFDYCCPSGSTAIYKGECVSECTNIENCAEFNTICVCEKCEDGYTLDEDTGLCEKD